MKVTIDHERCEGHQMCAVLAPALFDSDDLGNGVVVGDGTVPEGMENTAQQAAQSCPERAIIVED